MGSSLYRVRFTWEEERLGLFPFCMRGLLRGRAKNAMYRFDSWEHKNARESEMKSGFPTLPVCTNQAVGPTLLLPPSLSAFLEELN